jgi:hypothetical protein
VMVYNTRDYWVLGAFSIWYSKEHTFSEPGSVSFLR